MQPAVLFLIDVLPATGGTETHLFELSRRLGREGYRAIVCNMDGDTPMLRQVGAAGVEVWPEFVGRLYGRPGRDFVHRVIARAARNNVRAVHTFHFKSDWTGAIVARALNCPFISSRRDMGYQQNAPRRAVYRWINRRVNAFVVPSDAVRRSVLRQGGVSAAKVHLIYNGLDLGRFAAPVDRRAARTWLGVPPDAALIGKVGSLRAIKDHATLLRALARLVPALPNVHLLLLGVGPEEGPLRGLASELGVADRVTFAGECHDIPRALAAMDVFALSSRSEGMSNAILEAMAAGLPVVATDVGGNPECVVHGETGFIVPPGHDEAMAQSLLEVLATPGMAAAMGEAGRARAADLFDVDGMVRRTVELYAALGCRAGKELADGRAR
jgi:glycosyltransferase involved in cell wall biosynthesis